MSIPSTISSIIIFLLLVTNTNSKFANEFPSINDVQEFFKLSKQIYDVGTCYESPITYHILCHWYVDNKDGTQVAVLTSNWDDYIAIVFAGTDEMEDWGTNINFILTPFGPETNPFDQNVMVHQGFNDRLFALEDKIWETIIKMVKGLLHHFPDHRLITAGHSLGGALAVLTAGALATSFPDKNILSITLGTPKTGDDSWVNYVNSLDNLGIWRFVNEDDIVPRLPPDFIAADYRQVGHTVQLEKCFTKFYYLHYGSQDMYFNGVPEKWKDLSYIDGVMNHLGTAYLGKLEQLTSTPSIFYAKNFDHILSQNIAFSYFSNISFYQKAISLFKPVTNENLQNEEDIHGCGKIKIP